MSLVFFLLFLLSFTTHTLSASLIEQDVETLLKIKKQLGDPDTLRNWHKGYDFCNGFTGNASADLVIIGCITGRVESISMQDVVLSAPYPDAVCDLTELYSVGFYRMPGLYGPIPPCISRLSKLQVFNAASTSISGPVPDFHNSTNMMEIYLPDNQLSGPIPPSLSALKKLQTLVISNNHLTGTIPPGLVTSGYSTLDLSNNNLTGEIPKCYGWVDFDTFNVGNNRLRGDASFIFGKQKVLNTIILANNSFEFDLSNVESSSNLFWVDLSHNNIYGRVPESFADAPLLGILRLSFNQLCGELPQGGNMWKFQAEDFSNNACLCGSPLPPCNNSAPAPAPIYTPPF